jgi:hypothetical protein
MIVVALPKAEASKKLLKYTQWLIPRSALLFPRLMKKARSEFDAYRARVVKAMSNSLSERINNGMSYL